MEGSKPLEKFMCVLKVVLDVPPPGLVKLVVLCCLLNEEKVHLSTKQPVQSPERSAFLGEIRGENGRGVSFHPAMLSIARLWRFAETLPTFHWHL